MGMTEGKGPSGGAPTGVILLGLVVLAVVLAFAAQSGKRVCCGPDPRPSVTVVAP